MVIDGPPVSYGSHLDNEELNIHLSETDSTVDPTPETRPSCHRGVEIIDVEDDEVWINHFPSKKQAGYAYGEGQTPFEGIRDDQISRGADVYGPFQDKEEWGLAKWLIKNVGHNATEEFLKLPIIQNRVAPGYENKDNFLQDIDSLPGGVGWRCEQVHVEGDLTDDEGSLLTEDLELWLRDPVECVRELLGNPVFRDVMKYAPEKHYCDAEGQNARMNEMWTAEWWWEAQNALPDGATVVPLILASDKTKLSVFRGDKSAWPVYLTIGNIAKEVRRQANAHATILIGYLPIGKYDCFSDKTRPLAQYRTFHQCMSLLTKPLIEAGQQGVAMTCSDGCIRWAFPILAAYVADYPEQCLVACCMENRCPICRVGPKKRGEHKPSPLRSPVEAIYLLDRHKEGYNDHEFADDGMRPIHEPFWAKLPLSNIFQAFTPDLLHQLHKGVFKDHLVKWCTAVIGEKELDARFKSMPSFPGLRHFKNGISSVSQWTGSEHKAMEKIFVGLLAGGVDARVMTCVSAALDFIFYSSFHSHTTETLTRLSQALDIFHHHKDIFIELGARNAPHFNIPKLHSMQHYVSLIRHFGSTDGFNTESPERLHIDYAKNAYRASNRKDYTIQMTRWLTRQEAVDRFALFLDWVKNGGLESSNERRGHDREEGNLDDAEDDDESVDEDGLLPNGDRCRYTVARSHNSQLRGITASTIITQQRTKYFLESLQAYLRTNHCPIIPHPYDRFDLFKQVIVSLPKVSIASCAQTSCKNIIRASPPTPQRGRIAAVPPQMDFALISTNERNDRTEGTALEGLRVALVRAVFKLPQVYGLNVQHPLVYVEWFTPFGTPDPSTGSYTLRPSTRSHHSHGEIINVDRIVRNCHLTPIYGHQKDPTWTSENVIERCTSYTFNSYSDPHMFFLAKHGYKMYRIV
ncbi:hypothetical protein AAF712_005165 [Marasmius tenuissimus]|uniref:Uncharacterized protein n=1 Tax=Marasmius tenuissimus TaxID=585030 RepID=A0ABR3A1C0_9AGAR